MTSQASLQATLVGGRGFLGRHLVRALEREGARVREPTPGDRTWLDEPKGVVVFVPDVARPADPREVVRGHLELLAELLARGGYEALVLVSSTRLLGGLGGGVVEETRVALDPSETSVEDLALATAEALVLRYGAERARIARLTDVYTDGLEGGTFLEEVIGRSIEGRSGPLPVAPDASTDWIHVEDACRAVVAVAMNGRRRSYLVGSGETVDAATLLGLLSERTRTRLEPALPPMGRAPTYVDVGRLFVELGVRPRALVDGLDRVLTWQHNQRAMRSMLGVTQMPWM